MIQDVKQESHTVYLGCAAKHQNVLLKISSVNHLGKVTVALRVCAMGSNFVQEMRNAKKMNIAMRWQNCAFRSTKAMGNVPWTWNINHT